MRQVQAVGAGATNRLNLPQEFEQHNADELDQQLLAALDDNQKLTESEINSMQLFVIKATELNHEYQPNNKTQK